MGKVVLLNAFPLNAFPAFLDAVEGEMVVVVFKRMSVDELEDLVQKYPVECYIRHPATLELLSSKLGIQLAPSPQTYTKRRGDIVVVITLKNPERGKEASNVSIDDLLIVRIEFAFSGWILD